MKKRPNVLWLMSDQHNVNCTGYRKNPNVKTPNLDTIAYSGIDFTNAFANNPICSPSRICFLTSQYVHTHGMYGNDQAEYPVSNPDLISCQFRKYGYQTGLFGKSHTVKKWDEEGFETIRYTDLCDADRGNPTTTHYFKYLDERGLADKYEEGNPKAGAENAYDGGSPALLPYEHSIERYTGEETLEFLRNRDESRPFFIKMSFQRPHSPITPAKEHFNMYDPEDIVLPDNAFDFFDNKFEGKPDFMVKMIKDGSEYPLANRDKSALKRCLASYYALITVIDMEIGRVLQKIEELGEFDNTIILYTADHGDFAGEHGLFHKNFGIYDSIQRIPLLIKWPDGPKGMKCDSFVESIDLYPTLCELCSIPIPESVEGKSVIPVVNGISEGKQVAYCEWFWRGKKVSAIRTKDYRLVYYSEEEGGELYDHNKDKGETNNLWNDLNYVSVKLSLLEKLLEFSLKNRVITDGKTDEEKWKKNRFSPTKLIHKHKRYWSKLKDAYFEEVSWPPEDNW